MSSALAHQRVLRTVRLLPQAVKIGILENEIKQEGNRPPDKSSKPSDPEQKIKSELENRKEKNKVEVQLPKPDKELIAQLKALQESLSASEIRNMELSDAKEKLEREIGGIKSDYEKRKRAIEADAAANAKKAADEARARGHDEGFNKGHQEGLIKARKEVEKEYLDKFSGLVGVIENVGKKLDEKFAELINLNQPRMIRVWSEMLKRMLHRQVELNPDAIDAVLSDLLSRLSDKNQIVIYVSPDDIKHLEGEMDIKFQEVLRGVKRLELKSDPNVENGSCIVETGLGVYDARWKTQIGQIESVVDSIFQQIAKEDRT